MAARKGASMTKTKAYRVEWMHNGNWRMEDQNHPGMTPTRGLTFGEAEIARVAVMGELRTKDDRLTRIVEDR